MRIILLILVIIVVLSNCEGKRKRKFEGDFEFAEEDENKSNKSGEKKRWTHDPSSELCRPLNCKKKEICLLEDSFTAVCVSRKELKKNGDIVVPKTAAKNERKKNKEDDDDIFYDSDDFKEESSEDINYSVICKPCPVVKPLFLCGSDNRTYSSLCRLDYHNCIHHTNIRVGCKGFCPCKENKIHSKRQKQFERLKSLDGKYQRSNDSFSIFTIDRPSRASSRSDPYTYTPQDFKYDNKHYKYITYTKYNKDKVNLNAEDKERMRGYNEVTNDKVYFDPMVSLHSGSMEAKPCSSSSLQAMGNRLLDWFSVVMVDSTKRRKLRNKTKSYFPPTCKSEVRWMFEHLDVTGDSRLSLQELYDLEHDQSEICLKPFLQRCDIDGDVIVTPSEWCRCFQRSERPCVAVKHKIAPDLLGMYVPNCDEEGFYKPIQCHSAIGMCWCVDKHGVEFANTRMHNKPNCDNILNKPNPFTKQISNNAVNDSNDDEDDDDVDQDVEGSADHPEDF